MSKTAKIVLGASITVFSIANNFFGLFRSFEYIEKNAPTVFAAVTNPIFQIALYGLGISLSAIGLHEIWRKKTGDPERSETGSATQAHAQSQSVAASIGSIGPIGSGATVIVGGEVTSKRATEAKLPTRPNIKYCGFRLTDVFVGPWRSTGIREPKERQEFNLAITAIVVKFENDVWPNGSGQRAINVLAQIVYRFTTKPALRIDYGIWLGATIRYETMDIGDTRELLLMLQSKKGTPGLGDDDTGLIVFNDNRDLNDHFPTGFSWFRSEHITQPTSVLVTVIEQRTRSKYRFEFEITGSGDEIGVALTSEAGPGVL
jgi:hypothetical protein